MLVLFVFVILAFLCIWPRMPFRWSIVLYAVLVQFSFAGPDWHSMTRLNMLNAVKIVVVPLLLAVRYYLQRRRDTLKISGLGMIWIVFVLYVALACLWSPVPKAAVKEVGYLSSFGLIAYFVIGTLRRSPRFIDLALPVLVTASVGVAVWQTFLAGNQFAQLDGSLTSFAAKNAFGWWLVFCQVLALAAVSSAGLGRPWHVVTLILAGVAQGANSSRAALLAGLAVAAACLAGALWLRSEGWRRSAIAAVLWLVTVTVTAGSIMFLPSMMPAGKYTTVANRYWQPARRVKRVIVKVERLSFLNSAKLRRDRPTPQKVRREEPKAEETRIERLNAQALRKERPKAHKEEMPNVNFRLTRWKRAITALGRRGPVRLIAGSGTSSSVQLAKVTDVHRWRGDKTRIDANRVMHNTFLRVVIEWGLTGLAIFMAFLGVLLAKIAKLLREDRQPRTWILVLGVFPLLVFLLTGNPLASSGTPGGMGAVLWLAVLLTANKTALVPSVSPGPLLEEADVG